MYDCSSRLQTTRTTCDTALHQRIGLAFAPALQIAGDMQPVLLGAAFVFDILDVGCLPSRHRARDPATVDTARFTALAMLVSTAATLLHFLTTQPMGALVQSAQVYLHAVSMALPVLMTAGAISRIGASRTAPC